MSWVRVETKFIGHPKVLDIGPIGEALWLRGLCYAGEQLTDGFVPTSFVRRMGDMKGIAVAARLVAAGLWHEAEDGYQIHDYLEWQRSRDEANAISGKRAEAGRLGGQQKASNLLAKRQQTPSKTVADKNREDIETERDGANAPDRAPKKPSGPAQELVAEFCRLAKIDKPASYPKAVGLAQSLVKANITVEDMPALFEAASWGDGPDLAKMLGQVDRWRASMNAPPRPVVLNGAANGRRRLMTREEMDQL